MNAAESDKENLFYFVKETYIIDMLKSHKKSS